MSIQPYLFFDGRTDEAIAFYGKAVGAEVVVRMTYGDSPDSQANCDGPSPPADKVMHANLRIGGSDLLLADGFCGGNPKFDGFSLSLTCDGDADAKAKFDALADGGKITQPLIATFFATSFGMVTDHFGVSWIVMAPAAQPG
jgi:PhnB protein